MKSPFLQSAEKITKELQEKEVYAYTFEDLSRQFSNEVDRLWRNHIPKGEPIIINGQEGCGKTTICLQISKEILDERQEGIIVWLPTEGAVQSTLKQMAKLGLTSARFVIPKKADGSFKWDFRLKKEQKIFKDFIDDVSKKQPILAVFIDSLSGAMTTDENSKETGMVMQQINAIVCDKHKATLIWIHHLSRRKDGSLLERNRGHSSISASVRLILTVVRVSKFKRKILEAKNNLTDILPELEVVKLKNKLVIYEPIKGEAEQTTADRAEQLLTEVFAEKKKIPASEIYRLAEERGISPQTMRLVKDKLGIDVIKIGRRSFWVWELPLIKESAALLAVKEENPRNPLNTKGTTLPKENCQDTAKGLTANTAKTANTANTAKTANPKKTFSSNFSSFETLENKEIPESKEQKTSPSLLKKTSAQESQTSPLTDQKSSKEGEMLWD